MLTLSKHYLLLIPFVLCSLLISLTSVAAEEKPTTAIPKTLSPCPDSPNCVSSMAEPTDSHYIGSLTYQKNTTQTAIEQVAEVLSQMKRVEIVVQTNTYLKAEFTSAIFRFVDDVEFLLEKNAELQVRSASRVGYADFSANAKRVESIRALLKQ